MGKPVNKGDELPGLTCSPLFIIGQWRGGHDGDPVARGRDLPEIHLQVTVDQVCWFERVLPNDIFQLGGAVGKQRLTVGQQHVKGAMLRNGLAALRNHLGNLFWARMLQFGTLAETVFQGFKNQAEGVFAVGVANREKITS